MPAPPVPTAPSRIRPRRRARLVVVTLGVVVVLALAALGLLAATASLRHDTRIQLSDGHLDLSLTVPHGAGIETVMSGTHDWGQELGPDCEILRYELTDGLQLEAVGARCDLGAPEPQVDATAHERTMDDVADPRSPQTVRAPIGDAVVFEQSYTVATDSSRSREQPSAIVTFDDPADPEFPTLSIQAGQGDGGIGSHLTRKDVTTLVQSIRSDRGAG
jgi:hypothetical protein